MLPLAISFVTFQKIAYLVDCRRGLVLRHDALDYLFFVSFFPQLIAGPIVHHRPLIAQADPRANPLFAEPAARAAAFVFFAIGLFKKVVLADSLARYATPVFELARQSDPSGADAWQAMLAYTLQLYFDFSGYSDMAIGLALLFGFRLPVNFASPYQAASLIEFWRRWHMTLSAFLRDYLYIPLGGNRGGSFQRLSQPAAHHAAGGAVARRRLDLHRLGRGAWRAAAGQSRLAGAARPRPVLAAVWRACPRLVHVGLTFGCVSLAWVLFRAHDLAAAGRIYAALLPSGIGPCPHGRHGPTRAVCSKPSSPPAPPAGGLWIGLGLAIVWIMPNAARLLAYDPTPNAPWRGKPGFALGLLAGLAFWAALKWMAVQPPTEFLYFNF